MEYQFYTNWDVDKYKSTTDPDHHWQLKKAFFNKHRNDYAESRLVTFVNVWSNMEFLGSRYHPDLTKEVNYLASRVPEIVTYRDRKASRKRKFVPSSEDASTSKGVMTELAHKCSRVTETLPLGEFVLFKQFTHYHSTYQILVESAQKNKKCITIETTDVTEDMLIEHVLKIDGVLLGKCFAGNVKEAKENLGQSVLAKLMQTYYTIQVKDIMQGENIEKSIDEQSISQSTYAAKDEGALKDNIGARLMRLMGWKDSDGLGKHSEGIKKPIEVTHNLSRVGFGSSHAKPSFADKVKIRKFLESYKCSNNTNHLVFSSEFTLEERKLVHNIAQNLDLRSRSYGKQSDRRLTVSKKQTPQELLQQLQASGGSSLNYELIPPTGSETKLNNDSFNFFSFKPFLKSFK